MQGGWKGHGTTGGNESGGGSVVVLGGDQKDGVKAQKPKPPFRLAKDDSKPLLQDPILRADPFATEQAVIRLPPFPLRTAQF